MYAAMNNHHDFVRELIQQGAEVDIEDKSGKNAGRSTKAQCSAKARTSFSYNRLGARWPGDAHRGMTTADVPIRHSALR